MDVEDCRPFHIADYGAADGGTSMDLHRATITALRARVPRRAVCITYTDLPRNDYSALFTTANGGRRGVTSYRDEHDAVFVYAAGTSFFEPIFPPGSVDFGFSATAMHSKPTSEPGTRKSSTATFVLAGRMEGET